MAQVRFDLALVVGNPSLMREALDQERWSADIMGKIRTLTSPNPSPNPNKDNGLEFKSYARQLTAKLPNLKNTLTLKETVVLRSIFAQDSEAVKPKKYSNSKKFSNPEFNSYSRQV